MSGKTNVGGQHSFFAGQGMPFHGPLPPLYDTGCPFIRQVRQGFRNESKMRDILTINTKTAVYPYTVKNSGLETPLSE